MKSIRNFSENQRVFFENKDKEIEYHKYCLKCAKCDCKQSFRVLSVTCSKNVKAHTPEQYKDKMKKDNVLLKDICKKSGINKASLKNALDNNRDMEEEWYVKLEKLLYNKNIKI